MKIMNKMAIIVSVAAALPAAAQALPNLSGMTKVEGVTFFGGPKPLAWYLPAAFSAELQCMDASASATTQTCVLSIYNRLSPAASSALDRIQRSGQKVAHFRDVDTDIVQSVSESVEGKAAELASLTPRPPHTLAMSATMPYFSVYLKVPKGTTGDVATQFGSDGLGTFHSDIRLSAERVETYVALDHPASAQAHLSALEGRILSKDTVLAEMAAALREGSPVITGFTQDESVRLLSKTLSPEFFEPSHGGFRVRSLALPRLQTQGGDPLALIDDTSEPFDAECKVTLQLKAGATPDVRCGEAE